MSPRILVPALTALVLLGGCQSLTRTIVEGKVQETFEATARHGTELTDLGDGIYTFRWMTYRTAFVVTSEGTILFDPLNREAAGEVAGHIARLGEGPLHTVIYSHAHRDHVSGADALGGEPDIVMHAVGARELRDRAYSDVVPPDREIAQDEHTLSLGGRTLQLIRIPGAHTEGMLAIYLPAERTLYAVDIVWPGELPPPAAPLSFHGTRAVLDRLLKLDFETFIPGHGRMATRADVERYATFLGDLEQGFRTALAARGMDDLHSRTTFEKAPGELGAIFFEVEDALEPRYGDWANYKEAFLPTVQWAFWHVLTGD